ncbi:MAG: DNA-directed RNA polymerase subunit alpha [Chloroflexi bacterium RBG_16_68_14]|nr:MAG: DNA-directed RNA polymerase subunit alpha [Chloroflexi bacterium RBG_16_68_14]
MEPEPPRITVEEESETYARIVAEPLAPGFGITLGNSLRRVLLGSLPGAAITSLRIEEVVHEFSNVPGVKEDSMELLLNFKEIRLRPLSDRPGKLYLEATGPAEVHAGDIQVAADYEIVNPDLHLASLDSNKAHLTVEFTVERGRGYLPADQSDGLPIGVIPVDAIFTPVQKVNYQVEHTRVGQMTNFDKLILEVWTDGTMSAVDAIGQSADIMRDELLIFAQLGKPEPAVVEHGVGRGLALPVDKYNTPIEDLNLSVRAYNCLKRSGLMTVGQVLEKSEDELLTLRNFGQKSYDELKRRLIEFGYLQPEPEELEEDLGIEGEEPVSPLGVALIQALQEAGEDASELLGKGGERKQ